MVYVLPTQQFLRIALINQIMIGGKWEALVLFCDIKGEIGLGCQTLDTIWYIVIIGISLENTVWCIGIIGISSWMGNLISSESFQVFNDDLIYHAMMLKSIHFMITYLFMFFLQIKSL
jgi:hypothetical protein